MKKLIFGVLIVAACMMAVPAVYALPIASGTTPFTGTTFSATVTWEVYAPLDGSSPLGSNAEYNYFYQIANAGAGNVNILSVSNPYGVQISSIGWLAGAGDTSPDTWTSPDSPSSIDYIFVPTSLTTGKSSKRLYFTTSAKPTSVDGYLTSLPTDSPTGKLPGPAPEPSSMILLGLGLSLFGAGAIRKKFKA